jgi:hypothetical protein
MFWLDMTEEGKNRRSGSFFTGSSSSLGFPHSVTGTRRHEDVGGTLGVEAQPAAENAYHLVSGAHAGQHAVMPQTHSA